jgi:ribonuclease D
VYSTPMRLIADTKSLAEFCKKMAETEYVTVDTEFMREKTYWARLCLVQVAGPDEAQAIDALADGIDLKPLFQLMADKKVLKVFHAARQDLEIFYHLMKKLPEPVVDTQVAAMVCGFGDSVGYETLVSKLTRGARIDKGSRFTDWSLRPLSDRQVKYALDDVTHLRPVYEKLRSKLEANGHADWLEEEMALLTNPKTYAAEPDQAYRRIKTRGGNPRFLAVLKEVAAWREREAQQLDLPRNRVLRDEALVEIAHHAPGSIEDLARTRGLGKRLAEGERGASLLAAVKKGTSLPEGDLPKASPRTDLPRGVGPMVDLMKVLLKMKCEEFEVAQKLVASSDEVERIAAFGDKADVQALKGWRRQVFGEDALKLRDGGIALAADRKGIRAVPLDKR